MDQWKLRGDGKVAKSRVAFCRSFRIAVQMGLAVSIVCSARDRTAWLMSLADDNYLEQ